MTKASVEEDDLRDVFKLLYDEEGDWGEEDDDATHPPLHWIIPDIELDTGDTQKEPLSERYSKKRILGLLYVTTPKRRKIYQPTTRAGQSSVILSTQPLPPIPSSSSAYAPYSPLPLLSRLRTFHPSSYSSLLPLGLTALEAALHGWNCDGNDVLKCEACQAKLSLGGIADIKDDKVKKEVGERMAGSLSTAHGKGCAWRVKHSPLSIWVDLRRLLHPSLSSSISPLAGSIQSDCLDGEVDVTLESPITVSQSDNLLATLQRSASSIHKRVSSEAGTLAFFGWYPFHPNEPEDQRLSSTGSGSRKTDIVHCRICQRKVGLWMFRKAENKSLDVVREHLDWCPIRDEESDKGRKWWDVCRLLEPRKAPSRSDVQACRI